MPADKDIKNDMISENAASELEDGNLEKVNGGEFTMDELLRRIQEQIDKGTKKDE